MKDASVAWSKDQLTQLGKRIREARKAQGLTLQDVASEVGLTVSHISQIERGVTNPSVSALLGIAGVLGLPMEYFFSQGLTIPDAIADMMGRPQEIESASAPTAQVTASSEGSPVVLPESREVVRIVGGIEWQKLTNDHEPGVEFIELHYDVGASSGDLAYTHRGREYGIVLQGRLLIELGFKRYILEKGSSISFDCTVPHRLVNVGDEEVIGVWIVLDRT
jgi:transcriptional regulator with XRE-family HTH domain